MEQEHCCTQRQWGSSRDTMGGMFSPAQHPVTLITSAVLHSTARGRDSSRDEEKLLEILQWKPPFIRHNVAPHVGTQNTMLCERAPVTRGRVISQWRGNPRYCFMFHPRLQQQQTWQHPAADSRPFTPLVIRTPALVITHTGTKHLATSLAHSAHFCRICSN